MNSALNSNIPAADTDTYIVAPDGKNLYCSRSNGGVTNPANLTHTSCITHSGTN